MIFNLGGAAFKPPVLNPSYPMDVSVVQSASASATFEVVIDVPGEPAEYQYQWYVDNSPVYGENAPTCTLPGLTSAETYIVYCKVTHPAGVVTSRSATLTVLSYLPSYTFSGSHELIDDGNYNWRIKFKSTGTLRFSHLGTGDGSIQVFLVGGGGAGASAGGGGGRTTTAPATIAANTEYTITVGAGGTGAAYGNFSDSQNGGTSSAFGKTAAGGSRGRWWHDGEGTSKGAGGAGGSGGGGYGGNGAGGAGGSNGGNGTASDSAAGGAGQDTTTLEFGSSSGTLYAGGGGGTGNPRGAAGSGGGGYGGSDSAQGTAGATNTGGGGGGTNTFTGINGGSGIIVIRNKR